MADGYLERRSAEIMQGGASGRSGTPAPGIDALLKKALATDVAVRRCESPLHAVKTAHLEAISRAARSVCASVSVSYGETGSDGSPALFVVDREELDDFTLGQISLAVRLKAAEMGLSTVRNSIRPLSISIFR